MISLFLDTSSKKLEVILVKDNEVIGKKELESINDHASHLVPFIDEVLKENNLEAKDVDKIYVVNGPGSFTGTRIGVTVGKTLAYSNDIKVVPVSSLKQYIFSKTGYDYYISIITDKNDRMYYGVYDKDYNTLIEDKYSTREVFEKDISNYSGNTIYISDNEVPNIEVVKQELDVIKLMEYYKDEEINPHYLKPNYLKKIDAEEKL